MVTMLAERLKLARCKAGLTQGVLADRLNISYPTLSRYEMGHRIPNVEILVRLAKELNCNPGWFLDEGGSMERIPTNLPAKSEDFTYLDVHTPAKGRSEKALIEATSIRTIAIPNKLTNPSITALINSGEGMEPAIYRNAVVGVDVEDKEIRSGKIYAIWLHHEGVVFKRIFMETNKAVITADNPLFPSYSVSLNEIADHILGRVTWVKQML